MLSTSLRPLWRQKCTVRVVDFKLHGAMLLTQTFSSNPMDPFLTQNQPLDPFLKQLMISKSEAASLVLLGGLVCTVCHSHRFWQPLLPQSHSGYVSEQVFLLGLTASEGFGTYIGFKHKLLQVQVVLSAKTTPLSSCGTCHDTSALLCGGSDGEVLIGRPPC